MLKNLELSGKYKPFESGDWEEPGVIHGNYNLLEYRGTLKNPEFSMSGGGVCVCFMLKNQELSMQIPPFESGGGGGGVYFFWKIQDVPWHLPPFLVKEL